MKSSRLASVMLILAVTTALAACGDGDKATTAGPTTPAPTSAAPSAVATSAAATPASSPAAGAATDKKLCEAVKKANDEMSAEMVKVFTTGDASAADFKKLLTGLEQKVTTVASSGDGKLADALRTFAAEAAKAAAAADPATAADNPAFEKAGKDVSSACKAHGVIMVL
ncbi:hypothetical protein IW249_004759 [Micromonospora vinacea]|uniref:Uncharacterized protein n=1 Tax=Micromonospora vinacea TaxID=709878 RepID=A0ABS0K6U6_9ACTN|nr:hypothetical protein [Micromonospora vinacea]MBG6104345.1 hypothetical protein [Micromonospora vinacea]